MFITDLLPQNGSRTTKGKWAEGKRRTKAQKRGETYVVVPRERRGSRRRNE